MERETQKVLDRLADHVASNPPFPRDITHAIEQLFCGPPHLVNADAEAERLLRMFPGCKLTVKQMADMIAREGAKHSGTAVMIGRDGG